MLCYDDEKNGYKKEKRGLYENKTNKKNNIHNWLQSDVLYVRLQHGKSDRDLLSNATDERTKAVGNDYGNCHAGRSEGRENN